jgi:hypothetical protein
MTTYTSISDFLEAHGYVVETDYYVKKEGPQYTFIYPYQWQGLTVEAFMRKAREKGWVKEKSLDRERREEHRLLAANGLEEPCSEITASPRGTTIIGKVQEIIMMDIALDADEAHEDLWLYQALHHAFQLNRGVWFRRGEKTWRKNVTEMEERTYGNMRRVKFVLEDED